MLLSWQYFRWKTFGEKLISCKHFKSADLVRVDGGADEEEDVSGRGQDEVGDDDPQQNRRRTKLFAVADSSSRPLK